MQLRWLGTAGFELKSDNNAVLLIDPYLRRPAAARPHSPVSLGDISRADAILVTHGHFDHASDVPTLANRLGTPVYASAKVCQTLAERGTQPSHLNILAPATSIQVGNWKVKALAARHIRFDLALVLRTLPRLIPYLKPLWPLLAKWPPGQVLGFHITAPDLTLVHFGSANWVEGSLEYQHPDVALIPFQGRTDIAKVAALMVKLLRPRHVVPHHWDDFCPPISQHIPLFPLAKEISQTRPAPQLHLPEIGQWWQVDVTH